ncbi:MAG: restriction endonuclease subunit S [Chloroflexi bacterium]|nr:restriction endonuclease subunit S [Chloroflexota bacterium]
MRPYSRYRDSGVEWLGEVPEHWEVRRLEHVAAYRTSNVDKKSEEGELPVRLCNYTDVYYGDRIRASDGEFMEATASPSEVARFGLRVGDVVITKDSEDWEDIAVPALVDETAEDFVCGYHLGIIRSGPAMDARFLYRAMQSGAVNRQLQTSASGVTRYGLPNAAVGDTLLPLPPLDEQRAITAYLDRETERIDALVAKKRLLIERLEEYRTALITRTVTRGLPPEAARAAGLDPSPRLKPSGVEWLGEVPEHWEVKELKHCVPSVTVGIVVTPAKYYEDEGVPCLRSLNVLPGRLNPNELVYISEASNELHKKSIIFEGDVVVVRTGRPGAAAVVKDHFDGANAIDLIIVRRSEMVLSEFEVYAFSAHSVRDQITAGSGGAIQQHFNIDDAKELLLPLPPLDEQRAIVALLDLRTASIDHVRDAIALAVERLQEYRTALITAAVTGKVDVRE